MYHSIIAQVLKLAVKDTAISTSLAVVSLALSTAAMKASTTLSKGSFFKLPPIQNTTILSMLTETPGL